MTIVYTYKSSEIRDDERVKTDVHHPRWEDFSIKHVIEVDIRDIRA